MTHIVWLDDPLKYTYLRETEYASCSSRIPLNKKIWQGQERIIGYELISHPRNYNFQFRIWWLKSYDRDIQPEGAYKHAAPAEAVIPSSIGSGVESKPYITPKAVRV